MKNLKLRILRQAQDGEDIRLSSVEAQSRTIDDSTVLRQAQDSEDIRLSSVEAQSRTIEHSSFYIPSTTLRIGDGEQSRTHRNSKLVMGGFTLTEVLLVVVIIALVGGIGGGIYVGTHKRMLVEKAARDFLLTAQYARIMAIEQGSRYTMQLDAAPVSSVEDRNGGFWLTTSQWDAESRQTTQVIVQDYYCRPVELAGDVKFEDVRIVPTGLETAEASEGDAIVFSPSGTAYAAVVQIGDGKTHYAISVDAVTGKTTMYFGTTEKIKMSSIDLDAE